MIQHANDLINRWVTWRLAGINNGLGYPSKSSFLRIGSRSTNSMGYSPALDEESMRVDRALASMRVSHPQLWQVLEAFYLVNQTGEQAAKQCGCHRTTLFDRVHRLHAQLLANLSSLELGERISA